MSAGTGRGSTSAARARLLDTATRIFYAEGIHSVGVDRIIAERTGHPRHAVPALHRQGRARPRLPRPGRPGHPGGHRGRAGGRGVGGRHGPGGRPVRHRSASQSPGFRGCAFLNAVAEYPDPPTPSTRPSWPTASGSWRPSPNCWRRSATSRRRCRLGTSSCSATAPWPRAASPTRADRGDLPPGRRRDPASTRRLNSSEFPGTSRALCRACGAASLPDPMARSRLVSSAPALRGRRRRPPQRAVEAFDDVVTRLRGRLGSDTAGNAHVHPHCQAGTSAGLAWAKPRWCQTSPPAGRPRQSDAVTRPTRIEWSPASMTS